MTEDEKTSTLPSDVSDFLGMGRREAGGIGDSTIRPPSFGGFSDNVDREAYPGAPYTPDMNTFDDRTKKERRARFKASADMLFSTDVSKLDDAGASALYQSVTEGLFGFPDEDGTVAFGKRASKDPRENIDMLRKFVKGDYSLIEDPEYTKWRQMDEEAKFQYALEHETTGNMVKSKLKGERGTSTLVSLAAGDMSSYAIPWTDEQRQGQEIDRKWREDAIRNTFYDTMDEDQKAAYRADVLADYEKKLSRRQTLATFLQFSHGLSDRASYLLAKSFSDGSPDGNIEGLPEDERDRVYSAFSLMRGDQKKGRILGIQTDFTDDTVPNRLQLGLYGFQQSVVGLVTDTGELARDAAMWTYAKTALSEKERRDFFKWWDARGRAEQAMKQNLPDADSIWGEAFQGVMENFHWFIPYSMIGKGGKMVNAARGFKEGENALTGWKKIFQPLKDLKVTLTPMRLGGDLKKQKAGFETSKAIAEANVAATRAAYTLDINGVKKLGEYGSSLVARQMAAVDQFTQALRGVDADLKAAKWWKDAAGTTMWAAGEASAFSAFASEYIANADAAGISREESVLTAAAIGLINAKIEQLYVPGLESSLTPAQVKSLTFAAMAQAIKTDGAAGFRKWLANRISKGFTEGVKVTLTEGAVEEPLQQMAMEHGKAFDRLCQELRKDGQAILANEAKALWDSFAATLPNDYATFIDTAADMVPSSLGFGVTTIGNMTRRQHVHNVLTRHANRRAGAKATDTMFNLDQRGEDPSKAFDYDAGLVDVIQQAVDVRNAVEKHWQGEEDGGEAKNPHRFEEAITAARRAWRDPKTGDAVQEIADAAGVDVKTAEVLAQYLQAEAEATAFSPQARAWTALNMSLADIDEATIKTVLPGYVEGSFASDPENGIYSGRVKMDDGTEKTIAYRVGDFSAELMAEADENAKIGSAFGDSFNERHEELGDGIRWDMLSDAQRYQEALFASNAARMGSGVFELTDSKGKKVRVNADSVIRLANGHIADIGYGPAATQATVRHETFHSLWQFVRGTLADADVQQLAKTLGIDVTADNWERKLDERMAHEMERYASGHYVSHAVSSRFDKMLDSWAGKLIKFFGQFGPSDEVTDPKTGKPYQLKGLYDSILRGELGSGTLGVELRKVPQQTAERTTTPKSSMPVEVTDADRAAQEAEVQAEADESAEADEKVVQPQSPKTQGQNATVDESGATAPKVVHTAENPADAATPNQRYYKVGLPNSQVKLVGRLEVRDAETGVITSTDADYHDRGNQNRDDTSEESRALVEKIGANPDPLQVGTVQPMANNGIVWMLPNGDVIIGNHRVNGVRLGYEKGTAGDLEKFVREEAAKRGIEIGADVKKPLLVFVLERIESPDRKADVHEVVRLANESQNRGFNVREQASNDAKILTDNNLLPRMAFRADGRIDETKSGDAIGKFRQETGAQGLIAEDGSLTEEGQTRIQNAALAALLGGDGNNALLQKIMENAGRLDMQGELRALMKMTPELMALAEAKPAYDLRAPLAEALQLFTEWRDNDETSRVEKGKTRHDWREMKDGRRVRGLSWDAFMSQGDMFRQPSEEAKILGDLFAKAEQLRSFDREDVESAAGKKRVIDLISDYLTDYIRNARAVNTDTEDMFGGTPASRAEVMAAQRAKEAADGGVRFSVVSDPATVERLEKEIADGDYHVTYRAVERVTLPDGTEALVPPMNGYDPKTRQYIDPVHEGDWVKADIDETGIIDDGTGDWAHYKISYRVQNQATGKWKRQDTTVAFNPYIHSSFNPFNDQFSAAYNRPGLVVVRLLVPKSAATGEKAHPRAKDAPGFTQWKAGGVAGQLKALGKPERKVLLSNYAKIDKVLSYSDVADLFDEMADGVKDKITIPENVMPPGLKDEMEKRGYRITPMTRYSIAAKPAGRNKSANVSYPDAGKEISSMRFSIGTKRRDEYSRLLAKHRPDLRADAILDELDKYDNPKKEKLALHWIVRGTIWLPNDESKIDQAIAVAEKAKVDPFKYASPLALIDAHSDIRPTEKRIDPATVPELTDARDDGNGVVSYAVQDDRAGQAAMRRIIDTHWGKDANPWCLLARGNDASPEVMRAAANLYPGDPDAQSAYIERQKKRDDGLARAWEYWNHYNALPKRVAFKDGKLLAFMATEGMDEDQAFDDAAYGNGSELARRLPGLYAEYEAWADSEEGQSEGANFYQWLEHEHYDELREALDNPSEEWWDRQDESHIGHDGLMEIAGAKGGIRYSIAGNVAAANMGIKGAAEAEAMEKAGKDREEIWRTTGWWRGKDGKWRFELPSTKMKDARALYAALIEGHNETTLGKILDAPELFEAYPQLKDTKIILSPEYNDEAGGWYDRIKNEIVLFDAGLVSLKDMPSHERDLRDTYQRVLDSDEFVRRRFADMDAFGIEHGTVEEEREYARWWIERQDKEIARTNETKIRDLANDRGMWSTFGKIIHEVQHAVQRIEGFATGASGNEDGYSRFAGEVEARNASRREAMTPEERAATPPWETEDVPADRQIVRYSLAPNPNLREDIAAALRKNAGGDDTTVQMKRHDEIVFSDNLPFFEFLGLPNVKVVTDVVKVRKFNIKHHLSEDQIAELPYRYNAPVAVMKDGTDGYVLLTDLMAKDDHDNDKPVMVYLRRKERPSGEVIFIATAFAKNAEDEAEYYGPLMKTGLLFADENKIAGLALGEETESILRTQASGDHVLTSSDYSWWSTRVSIAQSSADRNGLSTPAQLLAAVAKGSAKRKEEQQESQGEGRYSTEAPRSGLVYPQLHGMSDEELVAAAVAARIALGKSDKVSDRSVKVKTVQNMMRRLHPDWDTTKIGVESQRVMTGAQKLAKRIRDDLGRGVSDSLVLEHLPNAMREQFGREMRQEAREGARLGAFGVRANTALEERQARIVEDAVRVQTGLDSGAIENAYGINLSETIMHLAENPLTEKDAPQGTSGEGEGSADEEGAASAEESEEAAVEIDAKVKAVVDDIVSASGQQAGTDEQNRKNRKAAAGRDAENEAAMGEGEEGAEAEGSSSGEVSEGDALAEAVKKSALDLENPRHLARFVAELARRQWIKEHGLAKDADVWRDLVAVQFLRKTAQSVYAKLVRDLTYSRSRETAMGRIAKLDNVPTVAGLLSEMEFLGALINAQRIRDKQKSMCEKLDLFLRENFGAQGRFKPDKEEGKRKVSAEAELRARYMRHAMWLTPDAAAEEARQLQETLDALSVDFKDAGRDRDQSREFVETIRKLNVLREFGALRYKPVGEIEAAVQWWQDFARGESDDIVREMSDRDIRTKKAAHLLAVAFADPKRTTIREGGKADALNRFITGHMGFVSLLQDCMRHASDADAAAVKDIIDYISREIQKSGDRSEAEKRRHNDAFHSAVESIYGKSFNAVMKAMMAPDERFTKYMGVVGGKRVTPTKGRALQLLVSLLQEGRKVQVEDEENPGQTKTVWEGGYHDNIVKHHREGQAAEIMKLLDPADMNMLKWLGQWYENNRADLSGVCHSLFGIGVYAELPNYFPVKMMLETQGLEKGQGVGWTIFPKALTPRVRNERDFDTSADIFSMWASRMEEAAQWKHHAQLGLEMRGIFGRAELREAVRANHGASVDDLMQGFITDILAGHGAYDRSTAGVQYFSDQIRGWTALCALGGNLGVMAKQTTSIPAFGFEIGLVNTAKYIVSAFTPEGMAAMGKIWDSEQRRTRWNLGSSEAVRNALSQQDASWLKRALQKSMITTKLGDVVPALVVGQGIYRDCLDRGMSEEDAMAETWSIIERTQQSGRMENQTSIQRRNKLGRIMFQFLSTQQQYLQYEMRAIREVIARPDSVKRWGNLGRAILLNHFILSSAYYWVGQLYKYALGQEPPEDELKDWVVTCLLGPYGSLFVAGFCCKYTLERAIKGYSIKGGSSMLPMEAWLKNQVNDGAKLLEAIFDSDGDTWENMREAAGRWMSDSNSVVRDLRKIYRYRVKGEQQKKTQKKK